MRAMALAVVIATSSLGGCDRSPPAPATTAAAPTSAAAVPTASRSSSPVPSDLTMPQPKTYGFTAPSDLGTLPEGVGIAVGKVAPDFQVADEHGKPVTLYGLLERSAVLLFFYRGGW